MVNKSWSTRTDLYVLSWVLLRLSGNSLHAQTHKLPPLLWRLQESSWWLNLVVPLVIEVHRNRRLIRDGSPVRPPRLLIHTAPELCLFHSYLLVFYNRFSEKSWSACPVTHVLYLLCLNCPVLRILLAKYRTGPLARCLLFRVPVGALAVSSKTDGE